MNGPAQQEAVSAVDPVAIIGMAFRLPGDNDTSTALWQFIKSGKVAIRETPDDRFDIDKYYSADPDLSGTTYSRRAGYVDDPYLFDPEFFRISMAEALEMDPQQRWMLQLCGGALENAGIVPSTLRGQRVGLFLTSGDVDYARRTVGSGDPHRITFYGKLGANRAVGVGRVAYTLGLQGPAIYVDSTCSASLVAVLLAAQSLRCGDCDLAIAGGVNLILGPEETIGFARLRAMSTTDSCRTFDSAANGYIREHSVKYPQERHQGEAPLAHHQLAKWRLFEMWRKMETARAIVRRAAAYNYSAQGPHLFASITAKVTATRMALEVTSEAIELFGANGTGQEYPVEKLVRDVQTGMMQAGENHVLGLKAANWLLRAYEPLNRVSRDGVAS